MELFKKLAQLADDLDKRGFHDEATKIDDILKEAAEWSVDNPSVKMNFDDSGKATMDMTNMIPGGPISGRQRGRNQGVAKINHIVGGNGWANRGGARDIIMSQYSKYPFTKQYIQNTLAKGGKPRVSQILAALNKDQSSSMLDQSVVQHFQDKQQTGQAEFDSKNSGGPRGEQIGQRSEIDFP
jgi:hypothetical protein